MELIERPNMNAVNYLGSVKYDKFKEDCIQSALDKKEKRPTEKDLKTWYSILQQFVKTNIKTKGITKRIYSYSQNTPAGLGGRLFSSGSLQSIWNVYRGALMRDIGTDIDMSNAHPTILRWICKKHNILCPHLEYYINNRDECLQQFSCRAEGKNAFIVSTNNDKPLRGTYPKCLKDYDKEMKRIQKQLIELPDYKTLAETIPEYKLTHNYNGSYINRILCFYENIVLQHIIHIINTKGIEIAILMFDGLMVYGNYYDNPELLKEIEEYIETQMEGLNIKLAYKEHNNELVIPDNVPLCMDLVDEEDKELIMLYAEVDKLLDGNDSYTLPSGKEITDRDELIKMCRGVSNDVECSKKLYELYPCWNFCNNELYVYDFTTGMWVNNHTIYLKVIIKHSPFLHTMNKNVKTGVYTRSNISYGNTCSLMEKLIPTLKTLNINNDWLKENETSSLGYILFKNGYYDFKNNLFEPKFNKDILFLTSINTDFVGLTDDDVVYMETILKRIFYDPLGKELGDYLLEMIARALSGECMKRIIFGLGGTNGGKSILTSALDFSLGGYFGSFNAENLAYKQTSADEGALMRWALLLRSKRIIMSNEIKNSDGNKSISLSGNMIKKLSSGGDKIVGRLHGGNETEFKLQSLAICLANDLPNIKPYDEGLDNRLRICKFDKCFTENPSNEFELLMDKNIKDEIQTSRFQVCFRMLILRAYADWNDAGKPDYEPSIVSEGKADWLGIDSSNGNMNATHIEKLLEDFELTGLETDYVRSDRLQEWLSKSNNAVSITKLAVDFKKYMKINNIEGVYNNRKKIGGKLYMCWVGMKEIVEVPEYNIIE